MDIPEFLGGALVFVVNAYFAYQLDHQMRRQNDILEEGNRIAGGKARRGTTAPCPSLSRLSLLKTYWPLVGMSALTILTWSAIAYDVYTRDYATDLPLVVTVAADSPSTGTSLSVVSHQTFEGGDVPLDDHVYEDCTFTDHACLIYNGGPYRLENVTFETEPRVCS